MSAINRVLARVAYTSVLRLLTPAYIARLLWRSRAEPLYRFALPARLGFARGKPVAGAVWVHAVSLGETRASKALIDSLRVAHPGMRLLLTNGTATGREAGTALLRDGDLQTWLPYDTPGAVRRFLKHHRPAVGVLMETEIWPSLLSGAASFGVPMVLANARLSARSQRRGERFRALLRPAAESLRLALAQTTDDAQRLKDSGVAQVVVCGNLKFDLRPEPALLERGKVWRRLLGRPVMLGTSTREGEEAPLLAAWAALPKAERGLLLLVPRHPQRFDEVAAAVTGRGLTLARRSSWTETPDATQLAADVWLGDSMGEMAAYYGLADVALLGGSFAPLGGQNLIEAAACGCPIVMGPHTFNFAEAAELSLAAGASARVAGIDDGVALAAALLVPERRGPMVQQALAFASAHQGAAQRMAGLITPLLQRARR